MLTQCPSCQTTFRVTTEILRVADGQVRCGRCQTQFDALERLIDERRAARAEAGRVSRAARGTPSRSSIQVEEPAAQEDITLEGRHIEISGRYRVSDAARGEPQIREETVEEWVEIDDLDAAKDLDAEAASIEVDEDELADQDSEQHAADSGAIDVVENEASDAYSPTAAPSAERFPAEAPGDFDLVTRAPPRPAVAPIWKLLAAPLALLLAFQLIHSHRHTLARHPQLGPVIVAIYAAVGATLQPDWDLHAYQILQWHLGSDPQAPGTLKVRANLKNVASFAQPYPLLKLVLEDRWGERVREREFKPAEYLDPATAPERLLGPSQQAAATISIVDPGPDAEGFRFDVCLRGARGIVCAADVPQKK